MKAKTSASGCLAGSEKSRVPIFHKAAGAATGLSIASMSGYQGLSIYIWLVLVYASKDPFFLCNIIFSRSLPLGRLSKEPSAGFQRFRSRSGRSSWPENPSPTKYDSRSMSLASGK